MPVSSGLPEHWTCVTPAITGLDVLPADPGHLPASLRVESLQTCSPNCLGREYVVSKTHNRHQRKQAGAP